MRAWRAEAESILARLAEANKCIDRASIDERVHSHREDLYAQFEEARAVLWKVLIDRGGAQITESDSRGWTREARHAWTDYCSDLLNQRRESDRRIKAIEDAFSAFNAGRRVLKW